MTEERGEVGKWRAMRDTASVEEKRVGGQRC